MRDQLKHALTDEGRLLREPRARAKQPSVPRA
jgi:hypothetical protein